MTIAARSSQAPNVRGGGPPSNQNTSPMTRRSNETTTLTLMAYTWRPSYGPGRAASLQGRAG